jgi:two-component system nitrogen regulation sensor histidine kinase NtrY
MPAPRFAPHDAAELLRQAVFAQRVADPETSIDIVEPLPALELMGDARMLTQALANILKNAGESISARRSARPGPGHISTRLVLGDGRAQYVVEDNGVGLPPKDRDRLTEPYVTTREKGTGLGLAIVKRIAEEHGGQVSLADRESGTGAKVILTVPTLEAAAVAKPQRKGERPIEVSS